MKQILTIIFCLFFFISCSHEITPTQLEDGPRAVDKNAVVTGTVAVKAGLTPKGTGTLFVIARPVGAIGGPPLAVARIDDPVFPIGFRLSQANVMIPSNRFEGEVTLTAKWSKMGSPMAAVPGDLSTSEAQNVKVGTTDIQVVLDRME
jgi:hypothetical protein